MTGNDRFFGVLAGSLGPIRVLSGGSPLPVPSLVEVDQLAQLRGVLAAWRRCSSGPVSCCWTPLNRCP